jgi:hypothetical protein
MTPEHKTMFRLSRIQFRLACELAAAEAGRLEYQRQISAQMPGCNVTITSFPVTVEFEEWPATDINNNYTFEWID